MALRQGNTLYYLLTDHLGSTSLVTNASGGIVGQQRYYPYGAGRPSDTALPTDYRFTGQRREGTIGLYRCNGLSRGSGRAWSLGWRAWG